MMYRQIKISLCIFILFSCTLKAADYRIDTIAEGLSHPWSIAFLPNGNILVTERLGRLRIIKNGKLLEESIKGVPEVYVKSQAGLFDIVLDPDYAMNNTVFISYAFGTKRSNATRIARAVLDGNQLRELEVIFTVDPMKSTPNHFGGRLAFLPDKSLLMTTGDGFNYREQAQKLDNLLGKTIRIDRDGIIPADNPFFGQENTRPEIWSYGHRNPQAIVVDELSGAVYLHEHGPRGGDELNLIEPGKNYGWPAITHGIDYTYAKISPFTELPGMEQPLVYWVPSIAPAGMALYSGARFPEWNGNLFVAALAEKTIRRLVLKNNRVLEQEILFEDLNERMRDVRVSPAGDLYLLTDSDNGRVLRITK
jgi:glucose/arabinose dehydrogenase